MFFTKLYDLSKDHNKIKGEFKVNHYLQHGKITIQIVTGFQQDHNFKLKGLRILSDLNGKSFNSLDNNLQDKLLDFQLYVVEIDSKKNANFDQIDLQYSLKYYYLLFVCF